MIARFLVLTVAVSTVLACATPPVQRFSQVKPGMHKDELLDHMGSPMRSEFRDEKHIYTYRFVDGNRESFKTVVLDKETVIYVGDALPPKAVTAFRLQKGLNKKQVLDLLGFPNKTKKTSDGELWSFLYEEDSVKISQDVQFNGEKISSVGPQQLFGDPKSAAHAEPASSGNFEPVD